MSGSNTSARLHPTVEMIGEPSDGAFDDYVNPGWPSPVDTTASHTLEAPETIDEVEGDASSSQIAAAWSDASPEPAVAATDVADEVATSPSPASAEIDPSDGDSVAAVRRQDLFPREEREAQDVDPGGAESEDRNYNFFDELDARLAGLRDAESAGDC